MEESAVKKIIFDFSPATELEMSRKRSCSKLNNESPECSKKIRKQLQKIDLSSSSSSMDTDDDEDYDGVGSSSFDDSKNSSVNNITQESHEDLLPSTSTEAAKAFNKIPKVNVLSIDVIKPIDELETIEIPDENTIEAVADVEVVREIPVEIETLQSSVEQEATNTQTANRIVISDSSEDEIQDDPNTNRRNSDAPRSSTYSFTETNGASYNSRSSFNGGRYHHSHRFRRHHHEPQRSSSYQEGLRELQRIHAENIQSIHQQARNVREQARAIRTSTIPDLVSQFRSHFQPLFRVADINQHVFSPFRR